MTKGLTPIYEFRFGPTLPLTHNEYSQDEDGRWWGRAFERKQFGWREVSSVLAPGWQMMPEGWELTEGCRLTRRRARLPKRLIVALKADADRMLAECLGRRHG